MEGPDAIRAMLESQLAKIRPGSLRLDPNETPTASGDVTEGWIEFETEAGPRLRPHPAEGRPGLDAAHHPRPSSRASRSRRAPAARWAPSTATAATARPGRRSARARPPSSATATQPYVLVIGGGQGGIGLGARLRQLGVPTIVVDRHPRPGRPVAQPLQVALPARPGLVRPPALHPLPGELAGLLAEGQDRRLARVVHQGDGAQLLGLDHREEGRVGRGREGVGRHRRPRRRGGGAAPEAARPRHRHVGQAQRARHPGPGRLQGRAAAFLAAPGARRLRRQEGRRHRLEQLGARHLRRALGGRGGRDDGAAVLDPHRPLRHADGYRPRRRSTPSRRWRTASPPARPT